MNPRDGLSLQKLSELLSGFAYAKYHGIESAFLGSGMLNFALPYTLRAKVCVCIGSGGGVVPALMALAQAEASVQDPLTILVDANLAAAGMGSPERERGWMSKGNTFTDMFPEIRIHIEKSIDFSRAYVGRYGVPIDCLHIDGDHTMDGCFTDFEVFEPLLADSAIVTLHDTRYSSVQKAMGYIRQKYPNFDIVDMPELGQGFAIAKRRLNATCATLIGGARPDPESDVRHIERLRSQRIDEPNG
jgi:hypothetical protein